MIKFNPDKISSLINSKKSSDKNFRQTFFLKEVKLSLPGLNKILSGKSAPGVDTLARIAIFFGKDMNYFFDNITSAEELSTKEIAETNNDFLLNRIEKMAIQINKLEEELKQNSVSREKSSSLQNVQVITTPEPT